MKNNFSKRNRHYSHECGQKFVKEYHGLNYHPTYNTEVHIPGKYAEVDVTLNLGTHPIPELTDITPLERMKANMEKTRRIRINTNPAPVAPAVPAPTQKPKRKISPWGWTAIIVGGVAAVIGGVVACKRNAA